MITQIVILGHLTHGPRHGYEIRQAVTARFGGLLTLTNSQLYPALRELSEMGAIVGERVRQEGRPDKLLYHITDVGTEVLHDLLMDCPVDKAARPADFYVRLGYFHLLSSAERRTILRRRQSALQRRRANVVAWESPPDSYLARLAQLRIETFDLELAAITRWLGQEAEGETTS